MSYPEMGMQIADIIGIASRFLHIASAIAVLGALVFGRGAYARVVKLGILGLLASGLYNLLTKTAFQPGYHMVFGIKFLLALHVFAVGWIVVTKPSDEARRVRRITGILGSAGLIVLLSAILRYLSTK